MQDRNNWFRNDAGRLSIPDSRDDRIAELEAEVFRLRTEAEKQAIRDLQAKCWPGADGGIDG